MYASADLAFWDTNLKPGKWPEGHFNTVSTDTLVCYMLLCYETPLYVGNPSVTSLYLPN